MAGLLTIEADIIARLREQLDEPATVASGAAIEALDLDFDELGDRVGFPLVTIVPGGGELSDTARQGKGVVVPASWQISILARHVVSDLLVTDYSDLDAIALAVISALNGWQPPTGTRPLILQSWEPPVLEYPGFVELVISFSNLFIFVTPTS